MTKLFYNERMTDVYSRNRKQKKIEGRKINFIQPSYKNKLLKKEFCTAKASSDKFSIGNIFIG